MKRLTLEIKRQILEDYAAGVLVKEIAARYGVSLHYARALARSLGVNPRKKGKAFPKAKRLAILSDYIDGVPLRKISAEHGVHPAAARKIARAAGIPGRVYRPETCDEYRRWLHQQIEKGEYSRSHYEHNNPAGAMVFKDR